MGLVPSVAGRGSPSLEVHGCSIYRLRGRGGRRCPSLGVGANLEGSLARLHVVPRVWRFGLLGGVLHLECPVSLLLYLGMFLGGQYYTLAAFPGYGVAFAIADQLFRHPAFSSRGSRWRINYELGRRRLHPRCGCSAAASRDP